MIRGHFTLPGDANHPEIVKELAKRWDVDAIRDSDGTHLSDELTDLGLQVYSTLCLIRMDNAWIKQHPEYRQQTYLLTDPVTAMEAVLSIPIMAHFFEQQFTPNTDVDIHKYWQVYDRTLGEPVAAKLWTYHAQSQTVEITGAVPYHSYTVTFLAWQIWEPVSMYNHITNQWTSEHLIPLDVRYEESFRHILDLLDQWLQEHPKTDVVRFTTFFYNFDLIYNEKGRERQVNWFGNVSTVSPLALEQFERAYGYALTPEDFVDGGKYHTPFEVPTQKYLDWMHFNQKFIAERAKACVDLVHRYHKKAIMFLGDHWAGTEPYGEYFPTIGLDAVVGAAGDGVTTRMIADIPVKETEARLYPYFFPDIFHEGGDPVSESVPIWIKCRRALLVQPMARMGYGGYLELAYRFPDFIAHVDLIAKQFREILEHGAGKGATRASFHVAVLNAWGRQRSWMTHQVAHSLWNRRCYSYLGAMEVLAGMPVTVDFVSFSDLLEGKIHPDTKVILNAGDAGTAWSGDVWWSDPKVVAYLRRFVAEGGGLIGIGEPSACDRPEARFALSDVLGVQREMGLTASMDRDPLSVCGEHYITGDADGTIDFGEGCSMIYPCAEDTMVLNGQDENCNLAAHTYGKGRSVYIAGLPYNAVNSKLLQNAIYWAAGREEEQQELYCDHPACEAYLFGDEICIVNNSTEQVSCNLHDGDQVMPIELAPLEMLWV